MKAEAYLDWDSALASLVEVLRQNNATLHQVCGSNPIVVLRDWKGQNHLCLPCSVDAFSKAGLNGLAYSASAILGPLSAVFKGNILGEFNEKELVDEFVIFRDELFDPEDIWMSPYLVSLDKAAEPSVLLLDRQDKEGDWLKRAPSQRDQSIPRAIFFGVKGGVGRSSGLTALALSLAAKGKRVLVVDADFESPGVSSSLLDSNVRPDYGIVDWLTAQSLEYGGLDDLALRRIVETSPLSKLTTEKILVAPSHGVRTQAYVSKLGRIYRTNPDGMTFAQRLSELVSTLERLHNAEVTLIDSRAGIDDTAAAVITQLGARVTFLFAVNTQQTWDAYALLFSHLQRHPSLHTEGDFRTGLRLVSALTPEEASLKGYWASFREAAYQTCANGLYDAIQAGDDTARFNFAFEDEDAPHFPLRITWDEVLRAFDPVREPAQLAPAVLAKVFADFIARAERLLE